MAPTKKKEDHFSCKNLTAREIQQTQLPKWGSEFCKACARLGTRSRKAGAYSSQQTNNTKPSPKTLSLHLHLHFSVSPTHKYNSQKPIYILQSQCDLVRSSNPNIPASLLFFWVLFIWSVWYQKNVLRISYHPPLEEGELQFHHFSR